MKKNIKSLLASILLLAGCTNNDEVMITPTSSSETFYATIENPSTRTYADENGKLLWTANDQITIFKGNTLPLIYQFTGNTGDNYGGFNDITPDEFGEFVTSNPLQANYAIYPYDKNTSISNSGIINYTIPATQSYAQNSFGLGANTMVAVTENIEDKNLSFKNLCGYFEFSLYGENTTIKNIEFKGNNGEKLAGNVTISATHNNLPVMNFADDATSTLTLDCGEGVQLGTDAEHATKFWIVVPAITYEKGITITITDTEDKIMVKSTTKSITIKRSTVQGLSSFFVETEINMATIPNNQIWYTATEKVEPNTSADFGAKIESNEWDSTTGKGIITFNGKVISIGEQAFFYKWNLETIILPNGVTKIEDEAFKGCSHLTQVILPNRLLSIGNQAFNLCNVLVEITIPNSVVSVGSYAIGSNKLTSITIPNSVTSIGDNAFKNCENLAAFYGKFASDDNRCLIIDGVINSFARAGLTTYTIPNNVTSIGNEAFTNSELRSVVIPNSVKEISKNAFSGSESLQRVDIPSSVISIGLGAFSSCHNLSCVTMSNNVTTIGDYAFSLCVNLQEITMSNSITAIGNGIFFLCQRLQSITIPSGVITIGDEAFNECQHLLEVTIPSSVKSIGEKAFYYCQRLEKVYCKGIEPPTLSREVFDENKSDRKFYVPLEAVETYKNSGWWRWSYADCIVADTTEN